MTRSEKLNWKPNYPFKAAFLFVAGCIAVVIVAGIIGSSSDRPAPPAPPAYRIVEGEATIPGRLETVTCPSGYVAVGGGWDHQYVGDPGIESSYPDEVDARGWNFIMDRPYVRGHTTMLIVTCGKR